MKKNVEFLVLFLVVVVFGFGCVAQTPRMMQKSALQVREFQTRTYETANYKMVMKAMMNSLQDEGFIIKQANTDLGLLVAQKDVDITNKGEAIFWSILAGSKAVYKKNEVIEASVNVSQFGKKTRVRVNFTQKVYNNKGAVMGVRQVNDPRLYKEFFADASKAIFLGKEKM